MNGKDGNGLHEFSHAFLHLILKAWTKMYFGWLFLQKKKKKKK